MADTSLYERAIAAKNSMKKRCDEQPWCAGLSALEGQVGALSYDERCVAAAGAFVAIEDGWRFNMPSTDSVIKELKKRDKDGDETFTHILTHFSDSAVVNGRYHTRVHTMVISRGRAK